MAIAQHKGIRGIVPSHLKMDQQIGDTPQRMSKARVDVPVRWQSAPNHPSTHLAYITDQEAALLKRMDIHNSGVSHEDHIGPAGLPSYDDRGDGGGGSVSSGGGASIGSGGGSNQSVNAAMGSSSAAERDTSYTGGGGGGGGGGRGDGGRGDSEIASLTGTPQDFVRSVPTSTGIVSLPQSIPAPMQTPVTPTPSMGIGEGRDFMSTIPTPDTSAADAANAARISEEKAVYEQQQRDMVAKAALGVIPTFVSTGQYILNQNSVGMPSILSQQYVSSLTNFNQLPPGPIRSTASYVPSINIPTGEVPYFGTEQGMVKPYSPVNITNLSPTTYQQDAVRSYLGKVAGAESGYGRFMQSPTSSASGAFGITNDTFVRVVKRDMPEIAAIAGTDKGILAFKDDPNMQTRVAEILAMDSAKALQSQNVPVTDGNLYISHFLGDTEAKNLFSADDNTPVDQVLSSGAISSNRSILGGKTVGEVKDWADKKMSGINEAKANDFMANFTGSVGSTVASIASGIGSTVGDVAKAALSTPAKFADTLDNMLNGTSKNVPVPTPVSRTYQEAGISPADVFQGSMASGYLAPTEESGFAVPGASNEFVAKMNQQASYDVSPAEAASSSPQSFSDWLSSLFDTGATIKELESQKRTATYPGEDPEDIKQWYADQYADGDVSKVKSRIVNFGEGPVVDYYVKDLGTAIGEGIAAPFKAVGQLFGGSTAAETPTSAPVLPQTPETTVDRGGRGGPDIVAQAPTQVPPVQTPTTTVEQPAASPIYTTGMNLARRRYTGNPLVDYASISDRYVVPTRGIA